MRVLAGFSAERSCPKWQARSIETVVSVPRQSRARTAVPRHLPLTFGMKPPAGGIVDVRGAAARIPHNSVQPGSTHYDIEGRGAAFGRRLWS